LVAITNNISSTITSNTIAITFSNVPADGTYAVLPSALTGTYTATYSNLGSKTATFSTASPASVTVSSADQTTAVSAEFGSATITVGDTTSVTASGGNGTGAYQFSKISGDANVGISSEGMITAITAGTAVIEVRRLGDDNYNDSDWFLVGTLTVNPAESTSDYSSLYGTGSEETLGVNGLKNLMNYALGGTGPDSSPVLPVLTSDASSLTLTANIRDGVTVVGQYAYSLDGQWFNKTLLPVQGATSAVPGTTVKSFTQAVNVNEPRMFLRLQVTK
jgi:hypothetical protein